MKNKILVTGGTGLQYLQKNAKYNFVGSSDYDLTPNDCYMHVQGYKTIVNSSCSTR